MNSSSEIQKIIDLCTKSILEKFGFPVLLGLVIILMLIYWWATTILNTQIINELERKQKVTNEKWLLKREACLEALEIAEALLSQCQWENLPKETQDKVIKQPVSTIRARNCYDKLVCSCDSSIVPKHFKEIMFGRIRADTIVDFRNEIRKELNFGEAIDDDREKAFIGRLRGDETQ